ncbi:asparagine synthase (glutamine-hydrolyzing) [Bradyrhizobium sp. JYMT SZCCT0180]|uniref:asparagine synthase (glutamine-hydrolyzing) n=1 Tax=Bradyrhizobium sp. JYMT SZCCT0180 TaxID=2807666 RepID=UPI001BAA03F3|nr:asparagine synthase (glutamine-hydrolyzing) [Bradyrhizobium sp. JYMT SZCCT0180]MBR1214331.1 asparagine synthase (glutamine-hydrolyzing) [Bradyrhizobium sp. JYMT SZCCT0180]
MCGLVALVSPRPIEPAILDRMRDRIAHRGPDGFGSWIGTAGTGHVGLGHRRLAILDLRATANQPMFTSDNSCAIVYNGEIYNFAELREEMAQNGVQFHTTCDTEVLLQAYLTWGTECVSRLNGMFAFAIWDRRSRQLFVVRDRFGEKPLFYASLDGGGIAFASEMKALFAHPEIEATLDHEQVERYAGGASLDLSEGTLFRMVRRVPAATAMIVNASGKIERQWRYWTPKFEGTRPYNRTQAVEQFRSLLEKSVELRLRSDVPLGACLSGGLDSSALVGFTAKNSENGRYPGKTYSIRFDDDPEISEGHFIDLVNQHSGGDPRPLSVDPTRLIEECQLLHWHHEEPNVSASTYLEWCLMRLVRQSGDIVVLNGQGADELLGGYQYYFQMAQFDWLKQGRYAHAAKETLMWAWKLKREAAKYENGSRRIGFSVAELANWGVRQWREGMDPDEPARSGVPSSKGGNTFRHLLAHGLQYSVLPEQLNSADRNAMAFGVEARFPFLDYNFVDWCIGLPDDALLHNGWHKHILRSATKDYLPEQIRWRVDKMGFAAPFDVWMRGPLKNWCRERLFEGPITKLKAYDRAKMTGMWNDLQDGLAPRHWDLWRWIGLNEWLLLSEGGLWKTYSPSLKSASTNLSARAV